MTYDLYMIYYHKQILFIDYAKFCNLYVIFLIKPKEGSLYLSSTMIHFLTTSLQGIASKRTGKRFIEHYK